MRSEGLRLGSLPIRRTLTNRTPELLRIVLPHASAGYCPKDALLPCGARLRTSHSLGGECSLVRCEES